MITKKTKAEIIRDYMIHKSDTGSSEVQIALLTEEINELTEHLKVNKKDIPAKRALLEKVAKRKKLLEYLKKEDKKRYNNTIKKIGLG